MARSSKRKKGRTADGARKPETRKPGSFWSRLSPTQRHLASLAALVVIAIVFFAPVHFEGKRVVGSDARQARAMAKSMIDYREATGELALWSPNLFSGMPGFFISYPLVVKQADVLTQAAAKVAYPTSHFLLLVIGMYALVFVLTRASLPAVLSAVAAGLTTYIPIILEAGHNSKFAAVAWTPWIFLSFHYVLKKPGALSGLALAAVLALGLRAGHAQIMYNAFFFLGIWYVAEGVSAFRGGRTKWFAQSTLWLAIAGGLAMLMVAQPYLAQYEHKQFTTRGGPGVPVDGAEPVTQGSGLGFDYAMQWSQGWMELGTYLIADLLGGGSQMYWGEKTFTSGPHYLGGIILALAIIGLFWSAKRTALAVGIAVAVATIFALGKNLALVNRPFFEFFPLFNSFRAPEIWLHMTELGLAILAGLGAFKLVQSGRPEAIRKPALIVFGSLLALSVVLAAAGPSILEFEKDNERGQISIAAARQNNTSPENPQIQAAVDRYLGEIREEREGLFTRDAWRTALFLAIAFGGLFLYFGGRIHPTAFMALLIVLVTVDLWGVGKRHLSADDFVAGTIDDLIPEYPFDTYIKEQVEAAGGAGHFRTLSLESSPTDWARPAFHYEASSGYHAAKLKVYQDLISHLGLGGRGLPSETLLDLTATRFIVAPQPLPGTQLAFMDQSTGLGVFERPRERWEARAHFVDSVLVVQDDAAVVAELKKPDFDRRLYAVVKTGSDPGPMAALDSSATASVELTRFTPHEVEWQVNSDGQRLLATSEIYYPAGWTATVDGNPADILQVNHGFRGVVVPAGEHVVKMVFEPKAHELSVLIALVSTVFVYGALVILLVLAFKRRRETSA